MRSKKKSCIGSWLIGNVTIITLLICGFSTFVNALNPTVKPRIIATNDGEADDRSSMIRFLLYSCDFDVVGIVENNSIFQKNGHSGSKWIQKEIDAYAKIVDNLRVHNPDYPSPEYLKSVIRTGNENSADLPTSPNWVVAPADMKTKDTPGSDLIIQTLLDDDPRPVHVPSWGGANTTAYALWKIKTLYPEKWSYAASRIVIYSICYNLTDKAQDGGTKWIIENMPEVKIFQSAWWSRTWNYSSIGSKSFNPPEIQTFMSSEWLSTNVTMEHGPLGALYGQSYVSEGDTPSWLALINNGLNQDADYTLGGWGGRPVYKAGNFMVDGIEDPSRSTWEVYAKAFYRWIPAAQNDFEARMDWCVASNFNEANHQPVAMINGNFDRVFAPGETISLDATPSTDPDGDSLSYNWWQYFEADNAESKIAITNNTAKSGASFTIPNEPGKQIQIVLEVTDNGVPSLKSYKRIILNIKNNEGIYSLSTTTNGQGSVNPSFDNYNPGTRVQVTATPADGWKFISWSGGVYGMSNPDSVTINSNISITANFYEIDTIPVYYSLNTLVIGQGTVSPGIGSYLKDTVISLMATPSQGWIFNKWSGDLTSTINPISLSINSNKTILATFTEEKTSINSSSDFGFKLYPNPINDVLEIELNIDFSRKANIQLFDNTGKLIISNNLNGLKNVLNMKNLKPGIYFLKLSSENNEIVTKQITKL